MPPDAPQLADIQPASTVCTYSTIDTVLTFWQLSNVLVLLPCNTSIGTQQAFKIHLLET